MYGKSYTIYIKKDFTHRLDIKILLYRNTFEKIKESINALNPNNVLKRGFSIPYDTDGNVIRSIVKIKKNDSMYTRFHDGTVESLVKEIYEKEKK